MDNQILELRRKLNALSVFRSILDTPVVSLLQKLIYAIENGSLDDQLWYYGAFSKALYETGGNISTFVKEFIEEDPNFFLIKTTEKAIVSRSITQCLDEELTVLQELANITTPQITNLINYNNYLPCWDTGDVKLKEHYSKMLRQLPTKGFGIFARHMAFKVASGQLVPVKNIDNQTIESLYGYERERNLVYQNTKALVFGEPANNVLLYGDAGTGKSSTIKACANSFFDSGLRLVEFDKSQLHQMPKIIETLYSNPLKFIFFIDDLSFEQNDDSFCDLKGILEGNICSQSNNIAIYATSNRRHLIKESMESRIGNDLHLNDTLQETMSLAARFGLTVTFSKPEKDLYLEIVRNLAKEYSIEVDEKFLFTKAEAFAIRNNGRSPRTAKQFIRQFHIEFNN